MDNGIIYFLSIDRLPLFIVKKKRKKGVSSAVSKTEIILYPKLLIRHYETVAYFRSQFKQAHYKWNPTFLRKWHSSFQSL